MYYDFHCLWNLRYVRLPDASKYGRRGFAPHVEPYLLLRVDRPASSGNCPGRIRSSARIQPARTSHGQGQFGGLDPPGRCRDRGEHFLELSRDPVWVHQPPAASRQRRDPVRESALHQEAVPHRHECDPGVDPGRRAKRGRIERCISAAELQKPRRKHKRSHLREEPQSRDSGGEPRSPVSDGNGQGPRRTCGKDRLRHISGRDRRSVVPARKPGDARKLPRELDSPTDGARRIETLDRRPQVSGQRAERRGCRHLWYRSGHYAGS